MTYGTTLFGWDYRTWTRAFAWAGVNISPADMLDDAKRPLFLKVRAQWLKSAPISELMGVSA